MITVEFTNVGRANKCFTARMRSLTHTAMVRAIKKQHALMSSDIGFSTDVDEDDNPLPSGGIYVGGIRRVGDWKASE